MRRSWSEQLELHVDHVREGRTADGPALRDSPQERLPAHHAGRDADAGRQDGLQRGWRRASNLPGRELTLELIRAMAEQKPERVRLPGRGFAGNDQLKANAVQIFKTKGVTASRRCERDRTMKLQFDAESAFPARRRRAR